MKGLYVKLLYVKFLCVKLFVKLLCVKVSYVKLLYVKFVCVVIVCGRWYVGGGGRRRRRRSPGYRIKNKNPTQRCGELGVRTTFGGSDVVSRGRRTRLWILSKVSKT